MLSTELNVEWWEPVCYVDVQLLPPSCFEKVSTDPAAEFTQTVNDIVYILDEYNRLK